MLEDVAEERQGEGPDRRHSGGVQAQGAQAAQVLAGVVGVLAAQASAELLVQPGGEPGITGAHIEDAVAGRNGTAQQLEHKGGAGLLPGVSLPGVRRAARGTLAQIHALPSSPYTGPRTSSPGRSAAAGARAQEIAAVRR